MQLQQLFTDNQLLFQESEYTCGPVTLLNILRMKGDESHTENELAELCHAEPVQGTHEADMVTAAGKLGLEVVEVKQDASLADLERHLDEGRIVVVCYMHAFADEGHYGLITEHDGKAFYFRDCSLGFMRLKKKYLDKNWYSSSPTIKRWFMAVNV